MAIYKLRPTPVYKIWGGQNLAKKKGLMAKSGHEFLGETWEVSAHGSGPSFLESGKPLTELYDTESLPYLIKFIDTSDNLSVQVHPNDDYALKVEGEKGKSECWFILDAAKNAGIFLGLKEGVNKETLEKSIRESEDVSALMNFYPVKKGDFFVVPSGTLHAIGKNVQLAEVQQCSGVTYRVWDWNRVNEKGESRELHVSKALDVIAFEAQKNKSSFFQVKSCMEKESKKDLYDHKDFNVVFYSLEKGQKVELKDFEERPRSIICLQGVVDLVQNEERVNLESYQAGLVSGEESLYIETQEDLSNILFIF